MTREEARRRAVEAAKDAWFGAPGDGINAWDDAIAAYERAMAEAGWRMVRDVGDRGESRHFGRGWNACRRAMLKED